MISVLCLILATAIPEISVYFPNATGAPPGHVYEMQVSYNDGTTWELLLDNIPSDPEGTTSVIIPELLGRAYQVRVRAWDSAAKNFSGLWSDPSRKFMLMYFSGPPEFTGIIR